MKKNTWNVVYLICSLLGITQSILSAASNSGIKDKDLQLYRALCDDSNNIPLIQSLLAKKADLLSVSTAFKSAACRKNNPQEVLQILLAHKANINEPDSLGSTALHIVCIPHHENEVKYLLEAKADIYQKDTKGMTPLHRYAAALPSYALAHNDPIGEILLKHELILKKEFNKEVSSIINFPYALVDIIYSYNFDLLHEKDTLERTALDLSKKRGNESLTRLLLQAMNSKKS